MSKDVSIKSWRFLVVFVLLALAGTYVHTRSEASIPVSRPLDEFPVRAGDWVMTGQDRFDERVLAVLLPSDYLSRGYRNTEGDRVSLYIGYHDGGPDSGPIHSPKQCLPGSGWNRLHAQSHELVTPAGDKLSYVSAVYQKDVEKQMFLYWFQVRDEMLTNEYALKFSMLRNSVTSNRRDSAFVRISLPVIDGDEEGARAVGEQFARDFMPAIHASLPR